MSKWTDIRDNIVKELNVEQVTEEAKQRITRAILAEGLPLIEQSVDKFVAQIKEQAKDEHGWCYWRDAVVLPAVMQGSVWLIKMVLDKSLAPTVKTV
ncbi:hypothetical protein HMPREF9334_00340 [Selenomonas infelix ATCC 43532]|mgnify:FL=1|uniref:Uncharacterized protein n=1 Tax=Selenomonas infelix ATCC 43532 TaxID=679201 RepID=G5GM59_9FIRM|nr:hypothetical protein [Selenomonas infelix]EHG22304.1 hypothetical protein HMPREF9334_00340 [Selenomonas infelix ATCC 43532]